MVRCRVGRRPLKLPARHGARNSGSCQASRERAPRRAPVSRGPDPLPPPSTKSVKFALATTWALCAACSRAQSDPHEQPAPATSVITLGIEVGGCPDIAVCERECEAGSADRCRRMAVSYALGEGAEKNETRATALYEHACEMDDPVACVFAGQMNEFAHGVVKDDARATRFYERGCNLRSAP